MVPDEYLGMSVDELIDKWFSLLDSTYDSGPMDIDDRERLELLTLLRELKHGGKEMAKKDKEFRLCYVRSNILYFTDNFKDQWGDDWNDSPYDCNAGEPYEWNEEEDEAWNKHHGHLRYIGFYPWYTSVMITGCLGAPYNVPYSVEAINNRAIPWLYTDEAGGLMAGSTMDEAIAWCRKSKVKFGELTE